MITIIYFTCITILALLITAFFIWGGFNLMTAGYQDLKNEKKEQSPDKTLPVLALLAGAITITGVVTIWAAIIGNVINQ